MSSTGETYNLHDFQDFAEREMKFAREHAGEDTARLLLSAGRYPGIDMAAAVQQIEGLRAARDKWPSLLACEDYLYPPRLNREQSSSEATARYKAQRLPALHSPLSTVIDLTGGMGIDTLAFARVAEQVHYVERDAALCGLMEHNLRALGVDNVAVHCADSLEWLAQNLSLFTSPFSLLFVDPARRDVRGRKVAGFEECQPNILEQLPLLLQGGGGLMVKASPMIDIDLACRQLGCVAEVHVVAVRGECKEVLFLCRPDAGEPTLHCLNLKTPHSTLHFTRSQELAAEPRYCREMGTYLYEPDAAVMKAGPFSLLCQWYGVEQLAPNSHLYTSGRKVEEFPGRVFRVLREVKPSRKAVAEAVPEGRAHVVVRNYPVAAAELQRQLGLREGGDLFVVASTLGRQHLAWLCQLA